MATWKSLGNDINLDTLPSATSDQDRVEGIPHDAKEVVRSRIEERLASEEQKKAGKWTRRGCTPGSFAFTDRLVVSPHEKQALSARHLHMIAAGGCVGAGLFVGAGSGLAYGGPAALVIGFSVVSIMIVFVVQALGELAVMYPCSGSFYSYYSRFLHPSWAFALGWNYAITWMVALPLELIVCAITMSYWEFDISMATYIAVFLVLIIIVSLFGSAAYGEEEFWSTLIKLGMMIAFIVIAAMCIAGRGMPGGKYDVYQGTKTWTDPGAFANGFKGVCAVFVAAAFALNGTEIVGLAVAETPKPGRIFPKLTKQIAGRCVLFYFLSILLIGFLVPYNDGRLLSMANGVRDTKASPFVIVAHDSGFKGFDHFVNAVILVSVVSIGIASVYGGSRTLASLSDDGMAPRFLGQRDMSGRAPWAVLTVIIFSNIAFMATSTGGVNAFEWLFGLTGLSALMNWGFICLAHISFRRQWKKAGRSLDELAYKAPWGITGSVIALLLVLLVLISQFYVAVSPIVGEPSVEAFFKTILAVPWMLTFAIANWLYRRCRGIKRVDVPLDQDRRSHIPESTINNSSASV